MSEHAERPRSILSRLPITAQAVHLGETILMNLRAFGVFVRFCGATLVGLAFPREWTRNGRLAKQLFFVGTTSVPVLALTGAFIGMILGFEGYAQFQAIGQEGRLGGVINLSLAKQLGPVLAAVMLAGRVGCALTAELGTMRVTEQLDAMRAMAADPVRVLVCPRVLACVLMIPMLTVFSNLMGVMGGWLVVTQVYGTDDALYWKYTELFVDWFAVVNGLLKSLAFGLAIGLIACYKGFHCRPGAEGVGRATTSSFVTSFLAIIFLNLVLAKFLNDFDRIILKGGQLRSLLGG